MSLLKILSFKNEFQADRRFNSCESMFTIFPLALFGDAQIGRNAKLLLTLQSKKKATRYQVAIFDSISRDLQERLLL